MASLMVDSADDRFAVADMPDGTWKLYERGAGNDRKWVEIDQAPHHDALIATMKALHTEPVGSPA